MSDRTPKNTNPDCDLLIGKTPRDDRETAAAVAAEAKKRHERLVSGEFARDEVTKPHEVLRRPPTPDDLDIAYRSGRRGDDVLTAADGAKIIAHMQRLIDRLVEHAERSAQRAQERQLAEVRELLNRLPRDSATEFDDRMLKIEVSVRKIEGTIGNLEHNVGKIGESDESQKRLLHRLAGGFVAAVLAIVAFVYARGLVEGADKEKLQTLRGDSDELNARVQYLERERRSDHVPPFPTQKGPIQ